MMILFSSLVIISLYFQLASSLSCSIKNLDLCDEKQSAAIQTYLSMPKDDLDFAIRTIEDKIKKARTDSLEKKIYLSKLLENSQEENNNNRNKIISDNLMGEIKANIDRLETKGKVSDDEDDIDEDTDDDGGGFDEDRDDDTENENDIDDETEQKDAEDVELREQHLFDELNRRKEYEARNYTWPPKVIPDTPGWKKLMMRRFRQLEFLENKEDRWNGYFNLVISAYVAPNFTENGWGLTRAPQELVEELKQALIDGMSQNPSEEDDNGGLIEGSLPIFIEAGSLIDKVLHELKPFHEAWSRIPLVEQNAYGIRVYRNDSHLNMHVDKSKTHIISCILHIDHDPESEPWPLVIEDFQGNTNEVVLESGDMLFYESSKCLHGRPKRFKGKWYSSLFVHYYPAEDWNFDQIERENLVAVPPHWDDEPPEEEMDVEPLDSVGGWRESSCKNNWCALEDSVKWYGPAKFGEVLTTGGVTFPLNVDIHEGRSLQHEDNEL